MAWHDRAEDDAFDNYVMDRAQWSGEDEFEISVNDHFLDLWNSRYDSREDMVNLLAYTQGISEDEADLWLSYEE